MVRGKDGALPVDGQRYDDEDQVIISTGVADGFRANGGSLGTDVMLASRMLWRTEVRGFHGERAVFPKRAAIAPTRP